MKKTLFQTTVGTFVIFLSLQALANRAEKSARDFNGPTGIKTRKANVKLDPASRTNSADKGDVKADSGSNIISQNKNINQTDITLQTSDFEKFWKSSEHFQKVKFMQPSLRLSYKDVITLLSGYNSPYKPTKRFADIIFTREELLKLFKVDYPIEFVNQDSLISKETFTIDDLKPEFAAKLIELFDPATKPSNLQSIISEEKLKKMQRALPSWIENVQKAWLDIREKYSKDLNNPLMTPTIATHITDFPYGSNHLGTYKIFASLTAKNNPKHFYETIKDILVMMPDFDLPTVHLGLEISTSVPREKLKEITRIAESILTIYHLSVLAKVMDFDQIRESGFSEFLKIYPESRLLAEGPLKSGGFITISHRFDGIDTLTINMNNLDIPLLAQKLKRFNLNPLDIKEAFMNSYFSVLQLVMELVEENDKLTISNFKNPETSKTIAGRLIAAAHYVQARLEAFDKNKKLAKELKDRLEKPLNFFELPGLPLDPNKSPEEQLGDIKVNWLIKFMTENNILSELLKKELYLN